MYLEPLSDIHLKSVGTRWDNAIKGDMKVVYGLVIIALLILGPKEAPFRRPHGPRELRPIDPQRHAVFCWLAGIPASVAGIPASLGGQRAPSPAFSAVIPEFLVLA